MFRALRRLLAIALLVAVAWLASVPLRVWWDARGESHRSSDAIVVLGAAQYDGRPSPVFEARLRKAHSLYADGVAPVVVTVGGAASGDRTTEAEAGAAFLAGRGVPADALVAVAEGGNTQDSLEAVGEVFADRGWSTAVLVTDPWHTFRAKALAGAAGIDAASAPARSGPVVATREGQLRYILRESAAYLQWRLTGRTGTDGPDAF